MKAIVRAATVALALAAGAASAQQAIRPDTMIREIDADTLVGVLRAIQMTDVVARNQREEAPAVDFKTRDGLTINSLFSACTRGNHPTRCRTVAFQTCWNREQLGRDLPDATAINAYNLPRVSGWAVVYPGQNPRVCMRQAHVVFGGSTANNVGQSVLSFLVAVEAFRRQFPAGQSATPAPATPAQPSTPAPATPAPATPAPAQ